MRNWVAIAGAAIALLVSGAAQANDPAICAVHKGNVSTDACTRVINNQGSYTRAQARDAYLARGYQNLARKNYDLAISDNTEAIRIGPPLAVVLAYGNRANAYYAKNDYALAIRDFTQALKLDPGYTSASTGRGMAHENLGDIKSALADYRAALAMPPKYPDGKWAQERSRERIAFLTKSGDALRGGSYPSNNMSSGTPPAREKSLILSDLLRGRSR